MTDPLRHCGQVCGKNTQETFTLHLCRVCMMDVSLKVITSDTGIVTELQNQIQEINIHCESCQSK